MKPKTNSEIVLYQTADGKTPLEVQFQGETAWLTQAQMAELFQTTQQNISLHLQNIFEEGELTPAAIHKECLSVQPAATIRKCRMRGRDCPTSKVYLILEGRP